MSMDACMLLLYRLLTPLPYTQLALVTHSGPHASMDACRLLLYRLLPRLR